MENSILNKISSIIMSEPKSENGKISLSRYVELMDYIYNQIATKTREFIKSVNHKLSNNVAFFNYEIKSVKLTNKIVININHELKKEEITVSPKTLKVTSNFKNKEIFDEIINKDLKKLLDFLEEYSYLNDIMIKFKKDDLNINLNSDTIELFMHKSPNWITMGKAFSLKYMIKEKKFKYELDSINLEKSIKNQEKLLLSKITFNINLLPSEIQILNNNFSNEKIAKKKPNFLENIIKKLLFIVKK